MTSIHDDDVVTLQEDEFNLRIRHDFTKYILLTYKNGSLCEEGILKTVSQLEGYKRHKAIKYRDWTSHIIVMFETAILAAMASNRLNKMIDAEYGLRISSVDFLLRQCLTCEKRQLPVNQQHNTLHTLSIIDIVGESPHNINLLKKDILGAVFEDFHLYFLEHKADLKDPHRLLIFNSLTEALAASLSVGQWYSFKFNMDSFYFRIQIIPSEGEKVLIKEMDAALKEFRLNSILNACILRSKP